MACFNMEQAFLERTSCSETGNGSVATIIIHIIEPANRGSLGKYKQ